MKYLNSRNHEALAADYDTLREYISELPYNGENFVVLYRDASGDYVQTALETRTMTKTAATSSKHVSITVRTSPITAASSLPPPKPCPPSRLTTTTAPLTTAAGKTSAPNLPEAFTYPVVATLYVKRERKLD